MRTTLSPPTPCLSALLVPFPSSRVYGETMSNTSGMDSHWFHDLQALQELLPAEDRRGFLSGEELRVVLSQEPSQAVYTLLASQNEI